MDGLAKWHKTINSYLTCLLHDLTTGIEDTKLLNISKSPKPCITTVGLTSTPAI